MSPQLVVIGPSIESKVGDAYASPVLANCCAQKASMSLTTRSMVDCAVAVSGATSAQSVSAKTSRRWGILSNPPSVPRWERDHRALAGYFDDRTLGTSHD